MRRSNIPIDSDYYAEAVSELKKICDENFPDAGYDMHAVTLALPLWLEDIVNDILQNVGHYGFGPRPLGKLDKALRETKRRLDRGDYGTDEVRANTGI